MVPALRRYDPVQRLQPTEGSRLSRLQLGIQVNRNRITPGEKILQAVIQRRVAGSRGAAHRGGETRRSLGRKAEKPVHEGTAECHPGVEGIVEAPAVTRILGQIHLQTRTAQLVHAAAANMGIRIHLTDHHPAHTGFDDTPGAGRLMLPGRGVGAWFEITVEYRPPGRRTGGDKGMGFRVGPAVRAVIPLSDNPVPPNHQGPHHGIR